MPTLSTLSPLNPEELDSIGFTWHKDADGSNYIANEIVHISQQEAEAYYEAANTLYDMYVEAAQHVIDNDLFFELDIPYTLKEAILQSWENDVHWHIYGRFDFAGGIDGTPIKLLEFNADTPTALFETSLLQWALIKANGLDETRQFNDVYEAIKENFKRLITLEESTERFTELYDGWKILFSAVSDNEEEEATVRLLQQIATDAGFNTAFCYMNEVHFDENEGILDEQGNSYEYWFKLFAWEDIAIEEPELALTLTTIIKNQLAIILNPAYTLLFQSKGMLKVLYDLFPDSPYLLPCSDEPLSEKQVEKRCFGREGANTKILDANGTVLQENGGPYENFKAIYQAYTQLPTDTQGNAYQAGVFFAYEGCALGFRRGGEILDNSSKFVGHVID